MFYLHVEITNYKQLKKIRPELIGSLSKEIKKIILLSGGEQHYSQEGLYSFYSTFREISLTVVNSAFKICQILEKIADKLYGFSIIISDSLLSDEELWRRIKNFIYQIPFENRIWLYEDQKNIFEKHLELSQVKELTLISGRKAGIPGTEERLKKFCRRDAHIESICDVVESIKKPDCKNSILLLNGVKHIGIEYNLDEALNVLCNNDNVPLLFLNYCGSENPLDPFIWSFNSEIEENVPPYLNSGELDLWSALSPEMKLFKNSWGAQQCSDFIMEDFLYLYKLYLKGYIKLRKDNSLLPIIVCRNMDQWNRESIKILSSLFQSFVIDEGLIPVCTSSDLVWIEDLGNMNSRTIHFKPFTVEEFKSRIDSAFADIHIGEMEIYSLYKKSKGETVPLFHSLINCLEINDYINVGNPSEGLLSSFDNLTLELLYFIHLSDGLVPKDDLLDYFQQRSYVRLQIKERRYIYKKNGC